MSDHLTQQAQQEKRPDPVQFIQANLRLATVASVPEVLLYTAHPGSGLRQLRKSAAPYWAYQWPGGLALARYILDKPETVAGSSVLDLGAGSGLVAIAAAKAGAGKIIAAEIDGHAVAALKLNADANNVALEIATHDLTACPPPPIGVVLVGDLFYESGLAQRVTAFLDRCLAVGMTVLIGDPGRAHLPRARLRTLAEYPVPDFGEGGNTRTGKSTVFLLEPAN